MKPRIHILHQLLLAVVVALIFGDGATIWMVHGFLSSQPRSTGGRETVPLRFRAPSTSCATTHSRTRRRPLSAVTTTTTEEEDATTTATLDGDDKTRLTADISTKSRQQPRVGFAQHLLNFALQSPLWQYVLVPAARQKIIDTAQANGILWRDCWAWLYAQEGPWREEEQSPLVSTNTDIPNWYRQASYHAYETGHLSWDAAMEIELASAAVGARNVPKAGYKGETVFRQQFTAALGPHALPLPNNSKFLDMGCATGTSTRWLAQKFPDCQKYQFIGLDLSPYFCAVGTRLLELAPLRERRGGEDAGEWVCDVQPDARISFQQGNGAVTPFADDSFDVVNLQFVAHELPVQETLAIIREAHRILKPGTGQLWFCEMDFESPAYAAQRANALTFALIRATEPYLDEYADGQAEIWRCLRDTFATTVIAPATGRHFAAVSTKGAERTESGPGTLTDLRFDAAGNYRVEDTHLQVWENKAVSGQ